MDGQEWWQQKIIISFGRIIIASEHTVLAALEVDILTLAALDSNWSIFPTVLMSSADEQ